MYELCLEYGFFPVKSVDQLIPDRTVIPDFLQDNAEMIARLENINALFHQLFFTIECKFDYIGGQFPEVIAQVKEDYSQLAADLQDQYGEQVDIRIEPLYI